MAIVQGVNICLLTVGQKEAHIVEQNIHEFIITVVTELFTRDGQIIWLVWCDLMVDDMQII